MSCVRRSGKRKRAYDTLEEAQLEAERTDKKEPKACHAYLCGGCGKFHVGNTLSRRLRNALSSRRKKNRKDAKSKRRARLNSKKAGHADKRTRKPP